jgi:DNA end-binding protein Ku
VAAKKHGAHARRAPRSRARQEEPERRARDGEQGPATDTRAREDGHTEAAASHGPRAFWSGTITFGLVSVPIDVYPAVRARRAPLRMLGPKDRLLQRRYYCSVDDEPLTNDDIIRGYEWPDGSVTTVTDDELDSLAPRKSRDIELQRFVSRDEIPPKLLERPYVLAPAGESTKAYRLLAHTMEQSRRAGIATFVMRGKEYLAAIFAEGGLLRAATMRFNDELRTPSSVGLPRAPKTAAEDNSIELALAKLKADDLDRKALQDDYTDALLALAERKRAENRDVVEVEERVAEDEAESGDVIDIMSVLKERMGAARAPAHASPAARRESDKRGDHETSERRAVSKSSHGSRSRRRTSDGTSSKP